MNPATIKVHWAKSGASGGGQATTELGPEPSLVEIAFEPVRGVSLWVDMDLAPALIQVHEIDVLGEERNVLQDVSDRAAIRRLLTGRMAWWVGDGDARLLSLGEKNLFRIDIAESSAPAHAIRLRIALVEAAGASRLAHALSTALQEQRTEHEEFVRQIDGILEALQSRTGPPKRVQGASLLDLANRLWKRIR
jgi:hypothetical protein